MSCPGTQASCTDPGWMPPFALTQRGAVRPAGAPGGARAATPAPRPPRRQRETAGEPRAGLARAPEFAAPTAALS